MREEKVQLYYDHIVIYFQSYPVSYAFSDAYLS